MAPWLLTNSQGVSNPLLTPNPFFLFAVCFFSVPWTQAKRNEHSGGGLGSHPTPDCASLQGETRFEAASHPLGPKLGKPLAGAEISQH